MLQIVIAATLLVVALGFALASSRTLRQPDEHETRRRHRFLSAFDGDGLPADLLVQSYEALTRRLPVPPVEVRRDARLAADLGLGPIDVEDVALLVAARCQGRIPTARDLDRLDPARATVGDLVVFLAPFCVTAAFA